MLTRHEPKRGIEPRNDVYKTSVIPLNYKGVQG